MLSLLHNLIPKLLISQLSHVHKIRFLLSFVCVYLWLFARAIAFMKTIFERAIPAVVFKIWIFDDAHPLTRNVRNALFLIHF